MSSPPAKVDPREYALFLDVDGTLVDIQEHPESVYADTDLVEMLRDCASSLGGALALVSGRALSEIDRMFDPERFSAAGAHGSEIRVGDRRIDAPPTTEFPEELVDAVRRFVDANDGLLLERKKTGVSLHYRRAPQLESACRALVADIVSELGGDFRLIDGKMVLEIAPRAHSKGEAIRSFLENRPFQRRRPVFVGDDVTDEDGFVATNELDGISIRVGSIEDSAARYSLADVQAVLAWLSNVLDSQ